MDARIPCGAGSWNPTLAHRTRKDGAPGGIYLLLPNEMFAAETSSVPQGLKPRVYGSVAARLKSCPSQNVGCDLRRLRECSNLGLYDLRKHTPRKEKLHRLRHRQSS